MKTYMLKKAEIEPNWFIVDADGKVLGRLASEIAKILRGKNKPNFTPHMDGGDFVIVINADKVKLTGNKYKKKTYYHHSGYPGGIKSISAEDLLVKKPEELIRLAVKGMIPKNPLGRQTLKKLKVYAGDKHPHEAQQPKEISLP
jgi:large subunit ribosomal protein L13